jgi:1,4-dihydroxy-6-naphthoate synthase
MKISLAISPCPNDTFIFDALVHQRIDSAGIDVDLVMDDVEALNRAALDGRFDVSKVSFAVLPQLGKDYVLLDSGSALGRGCGPLLVARDPDVVRHMETAKIAIPGRLTTAFMLLGIAFPEINHTEEIIFSSIEEAVADGRADAGLIIHESRFTYREKGLQSVMDLGDFWENRTGMPIPLGGIVIHRRIPAQQRLEFDRLLRESVEYAFRKPGACRDFVRQHAQSMQDQVIEDHIRLYVNEYSVSLGEEGRSAVSELLGLDLVRQGRLFQHPAENPMRGSS